MIDKRITAGAESFKKLFAHLSLHHPALVLDGSWVSLAVVDNITFPLRGRASINDGERELLHLACCYMGKILYEIWEKFDTAVFLEERNASVVLRAVGGELLPGGAAHEIPVERAYLALLINPPTDMPIFSEFSRPVCFDSEITQNFCLGIACGLSPFGEGSWNAEDCSTFAPQVEIAKKHIARSLASTYSRLFPEEQLGQLPELYLQRLVFPPMMMEEPFPAYSVVDEVLDYFSEIGITARNGMKNSVSYSLQARSPLLSLAQNFLTFPLEIPCMFAQVCWVSYMPVRPSSSILAQFESWRQHTSLLFETLCHAKARLRSSFWFESDVLTADTEQELFADVLYGFLPWLKLSPNKLKERVESPVLNEFIKALCKQDLQGSRRIAEQLVSEFPGDLELRLQQAFLERIKGDLDKEAQMCREILSESGAENVAEVNAALGMSCVLRGELAEGDRFLSKAVELGTVHEVARSEHLVNLIWVKVLESLSEEALEVVFKAEKEESYLPFTLLKNKYDALHMLERMDEADEVSKQLISINPFDRGVFSLLLT